MTDNTTQVHISQIKVGDTIFHNGKARTVCNRVLKTCEFMGTTLFGDSYSIGHKLVTRIDL